MPVLLAQTEDDDLIEQFDGLTWEDWALAAATLLIGLVIARLIGRGVGKLVGRTPASELVAKIFERAVSGVLGFLAFYFSLQFLGVPLGPLVGALGIAGLALAFAFQAILENFIAGVLLLMRRPITIGDEIVTDDYEGRVVDISLRATEMITLDGETVFIPNSMVWTNPLTNITATPDRRTTLEVGVAYDTDLDAAKALIEGTVAGVDGVRQFPTPTAQVYEFGESSINFAVRYWHNADTPTLWRVRDEVARTIKRAFDANGIEIPFPQRVVHLPER